MKRPLILTNSVLDPYTLNADPDLSLLVNMDPDPEAKIQADPDLYMDPKHRSPVFPFCMH